MIPVEPPWEMASDPFWSSTRVIVGNNGKTAVCQRFVGLSDTFEAPSIAQENATFDLLLAAPDMLEALEALVSAFDPDESAMKPWRLARAAIRKARGGDR